MKRVIQKIVRGFNYQVGSQLGYKIVKKTKDIAIWFCPNQRMKILLSGQPLSWMESYRMIIEEGLTPKKFYDYFFKQTQKGKELFLGQLLVFDVDKFTPYALHLDSRIFSYNELNTISLLTKIEKSEKGRGLIPPKSQYNYLLDSQKKQIEICVANNCLGGIKVWTIVDNYKTGLKINPIISHLFNDKKEVANKLCKIPYTNYN